MADVHLAVRDRGTEVKDLVAVKVPKEEVAENPEFVNMFLDEARLAARLDHPNIVKTLEVGEAVGTQFIAMEYLDGQSLSRIIANVPDLPLGMHLWIIADVLRGIDYAHQLTDDEGKPLNVIHRDLTPQNIVVTHDGVVKILDFGIARAEGRASQTLAGQFKGKVTYMSPEQAKGRELDRRADLFSVGVMIFEACIGERMWKGVKEVEVLATLLGRRHPRNPQMINPEIHDDLDAICHRALSVIDHRYQTASDLLKDLEAHLEEHVERPTREEIAELLKTRFAEKRAIVDARIEAKLKELAEAKLTGVSAPPKAKSEGPAPPPVPKKPPLPKKSGPVGELALVSDFPSMPPPPPIGAGEPTPRGAGILVSPDAAAALAKARASRPSHPAVVEEDAPASAEDEAAADRRHKIRMTAILVAAAIVASLLTLLVKQLF
jgi:serine/threonine-protein kinase